MSDTKPWTEEVSEWLEADRPDPEINNMKELLRDLLNYCYLLETLAFKGKFIEDEEIIKRVKAVLK